MGATGNGCAYFLWGEDMSRFPHLTANGNESDFPNIANVKTYEYDNKIDYSRFDNVQMNITLCKVPWDMGEAHVGNRTISGIGNVVWFGDKETRDKWFDDIPDSECYRFATKYKELHRDNSIVVPIPFDVAARYNYVAVEYEPFASSGDLLEYEGTSGLENWYWFVREVEFLAPNSTRLHLLNDAWQTFIYDMDIPYMMLERGHYGMARTSADSYLSNPILNNSFLLAPEMNEPEKPRIATETHAHVFNAGDMYAVIVTSSNPAGYWGSKAYGNWQVPSVQVYVGGVPSCYVFAVKTSDFQGFISNVSANYPQFLQTVQGVFFVSSELLDIQGAFRWAGTSCYWIHAYNKTANLHTLTKADFGYPAHYADIAKLYTYPYAMIVLTDSDGNKTEIRIEDTNGKVNINFALSLAYPWIKINGSVSSVGKTPSSRISFSNIESGAMPIAGNWFDLLFSYDVPMFAVTQAASEINDYATHFDRAQQAYAGDNAQANQNANAANTVNNAAVTTAANSSVTAASNTSAYAVSSNTQTYNTGTAAASNIISQMGTSSTIAANEMQGSIAAASGFANSAIGAVASGNAVGAASGILSGIVGAASTIASTNVANGLTAVNASLAQAANSGGATAANTKTSWDTDAQVAAANDITSAQNTATSGHAANDSATIISNASRDRATVTGAINNQIAQAALGAPEIFGEMKNGDYATTRPLAIFSNVITQDDYTIKKCGDDFLRYGYSLDAQIDFDGNWCVMPKFTYWRLSDFWVKGLQVPDLYVDKIRFFLFGGVTVWKNPEDIGHVSIYENV